MLKVTIIKRSVYYHDKANDRHLRKVEGPCGVCGEVFVGTFFGTESGAESNHVCDKCKVARQEYWK